jgi:secreted trypsin-like serine protease
MRGSSLRFLLAVIALLQAMNLAFSQGSSSTNNDAKVDDLESEISYRVIGGTPAGDGAWPWQVALYWRETPTGDFRMICGGSLIDQNWVLTAAHCILSPDASKFRVVEGTNRIDGVIKPNGKNRNIAVAQIIRHEAYDEQRFRNDIALVKLARPATSSPVALAFPGGGDLFEGIGQSSTITGWGAIRPFDPRTWTDPITHEKMQPSDPKYFPNRLQQADLPIVACPEYWTIVDHQKVKNQADQRNLCTQVKNGGQSSCQGDSGGPLVAKKPDGRFAQIGIVSFGGTPCDQGPSYFARVSAFESWIEAKSGLKLAGPGPEPSPKPSPSPTPEPPQPSPRPPGPISDVRNPAGVVVTILQGDSLRIGQIAQFQVTTNKPGYLVLLDITPDRKITQVFPNERSLSTPSGGQAKSNYVGASHPLVIPNPKNPYEGFEFRTEPPSGEGLLVAILSADPMKSISLPESPRTMEGTEALEFVSGLTTELRQNLEVDGAARDRDWSFVIRKYQVVK